LPQSRTGEQPCATSMRSIISFPSASTN
jgi:hypothetical protein